MEFSHLTSADVSDVGRKRKNNEDAVMRLPAAGVFCVADGMGGAAGGEVASRWSLEEIQRVFATRSPSVSKRDIVRQALGRASARIKAMAEEKGAIGTGTTVVILVFDDYQPGHADILHAGDSRAYRLRKGKLERLSRDHSLAASAGIKHEKLLPSIFRGVVTRAVGLEPTVDLEKTSVNVEAGDLFLLCSDGLTKMVSDGRLQRLIAKARADNIEALARMLVDEANRAGGEDNISVVLISVGSLPPPEPPPESAATGGENDTADTAVLLAGAAKPAEDAERHSDTEHSADSQDILVGVTPDTGHAAAPPDMPPVATPVTPDSDGEVVGDTPETPISDAAAVIKPPFALATLTARRWPVMQESLIWWAIRIVALVLAVLMVLEIAKIVYERYHWSNLTPGLRDETGADRASFSRQAADVSGAAETERSRAAAAADPQTEELAALLAQRINEAFRNGAWGKVAELLQPAGAVPEVVVRRVENMEKARGWIAEWEHCRRDPAYGGQTLLVYTLTVSNLCAQMGAPPPPTPPPGGATDEARANAACRQMFGLQQYLLAKTKVFIRERYQEIEVFSDNPARLIGSLYAFSGFPLQTEKYPFEQLMSNVRTVARWLTDDKERQIPLQEIKAGPPSVIPALVTQRNQLWNLLLQDIQTCGAAAEKRKAAKGDDPLLNNIAALQKKIVKHFESGRGRAGGLPWPARESLPSIEALLNYIDQFMSAAQSGPAPQDQG